jgi:signal transduction histidine kinase/ligand-binding sensor domain-containing protein
LRPAWASALLPAWLPALFPTLLAMGALFCALCWPLHALAQQRAPEFDFAEPYFETVENQEFIPGGVVAALLQDQRGLLWIGTQNGLVRYDAYSARRFVHTAGDPYSLTGNFVRTLAQGKDGKLWIGTIGDGLSRFDPEREQFDNLRHDPARPDSLTSNQVNAIVSDASGNLWVATNKGLDYLAFGRDQFIHYRHDPARRDSLLDNDVRTVILDKDGWLWVGGSEGLQRLRPGQTGFETIIDSAGKAASAQVRAGHNIWSLFQAQDGKIWIGTVSRGAAWLDPDGRSLHWLPLQDSSAPASGQNRAGLSRAALSHGWVVAIAQPEAGQIWLGSAGGGINIVAAADGTVLRQLRHDPAITGSLALDNLGALLPDRSGMLWVGTWGGGLQRFQVGNRAILALRHSPSKPHGPSHTEIASVLELADGRILLGTAGNGIDVIDRQQGLIGGYRPARGGPPDPRWPGLPDVAVLSMVQQKDGTLWVGTRQAGVLRLAPGASAWQAFGVASGLPDVRVTSLLLTRAGQLWVGTLSGPARWQHNLQRFTAVPTGDGSALKANVNTMAEDGAGSIWVGSNLGLWQQRPGAAGLQPHLHQPERASSPRANRINGLLVDRHDTLWIASAEGLDWRIGQNGANMDFGHVPDTGEAEGRRVGHNLLEDSDGRIWSEAFVYDPKRASLLELSRADGLDLGNSRVGARAATRDGYLMFGGTQGLVLIDPKRFVPWHYQPGLVVTHFQLDGMRRAPGTLATSVPQRLELAPGQRSFSIEFAALDYSRPQKNRYRYRMQGYDQDWIMTDATRRSASYGNLWPGDYRLQIEGSNRYGQWSGQRLDIPLRVLPAFWQTLWFATLSCLLAGGGAVWLWRVRVARLADKSRRLQRLIDERTADILNLGKIGQELTATLDTEQAFERVYAKVSARLDAHVFIIGIYQAQQQQISLVYEIENGVRQPHELISMSDSERPAVWCVREQRELATERMADLLRYVRVVLPPTRGEIMQTVVYLPLMVQQRVIGCLSVQSPRTVAYDADQLEFLRVLASYTAIAISNSLAHGELAQAHGELAQSHTQLATAHHHLQETQAQLVQSEKMASLGQLVASVAHEINNPISAVKASGSNIADALDRALLDLPKVLKLLSDEQEQAFQALIDQTRHSTSVQTSREARAMARDWRHTLEQHGIANAEHKAGILVQLHATPDLPGLLPLLRHPDADFIVHTANSVAVIINNTSNINLAVARVAKIVFALKAFSRSGQGGEMMVSDLRTGLEMVLTIYQNQIRQGTELVCDYQALPALLCYPDELNQVWTNLIHNALQAMSYHGTLTIKLAKVGHEAVVSIGDSGCGIPPAIRDKIFDAFFTTKPIGEGSGLGLDIVKKIVDKHKGRIEVVSEMGVGSTFSVYLPYPDEG